MEGIADRIGTAALRLYEIVTPPVGKPSSGVGRRARFRDSRCDCVQTAAPPTSEVTSAATVAAMTEDAFYSPNRPPRSPRIREARQARVDVDKGNGSVLHELRGRGEDG